MFNNNIVEEGRWRRGPDSMRSRGIKKKMPACNELFEERRLAADIEVRHGIDISEVGAPKADH